MTCPLCEVDPARVFHEAPLIRCLWDGFPVSEGHALIVTRHHVATWFEAHDDERLALFEGIEIARRVIEARFAPSGWNIGVNVGEAAGQTVPHLHLHVIPRYRGDVEDPRGGVRCVVPHRARYWE